jgi:hypothetical protein
VANEIIKKAIIKKADLPPINGENKSYIIRYRIISEDKNRTSHWSPNYALVQDPIVGIDSTKRSITVSGTGSTKTVTAVWEPPSDINLFDIYIKNANDPDSKYIYKTTISNPTYATVTTTGTPISLLVQVQTYPKGKFAGLILFEETNISV